MSDPGLDAIILTGGRARRLGGADKAALRLDGDRLISRSLAAARAGGASRCVVVGPATPGIDAPIVREHPAFGGPVAGLAAGLAHLGPAAQGALVLTLAVDLVHPEAVVATLTGALPLPQGRDGVALRDPGGQMQWLAGCYTRSYLDRAIADAGEVSGVSMRRLLAPARLSIVQATQSTVADIDTWDDLAKHSDGKSDMSDLPPIQAWVNHVCTELGVDPASVDIRALLDMTKDVAHKVDRPAAPITAFIVGAAAAGGSASVRDLSDKAAALARDWQQP
ncbi:MAG: NTP transferase domain-containing protein [Beutenbergiaceae bacterium]